MSLFSNKGSHASGKGSSENRSTEQYRHTPEPRKNSRRQETYENHDRRRNQQRVTNEDELRRARIEEMRRQNEQHQLEIRRKKASGDSADYGSVAAQIKRYRAFKTKKRIMGWSTVLIAVIGVIVLWTLHIKAPDIVVPDTTTKKSTVVKKDNTTTVTPDETEEGDVLDISSTSARKTGCYTFLIVGSDDGNGNTDTMLVGMLDTVNKQLNVVSIPRDTLVNVSWSIKKVKSIMANKGGPSGLAEGLKDILGYTVDCYASIDLQAFVELVDAVGGVDFDVPQDMDYDDSAQDLYIHISKGYQHLTGEEAIKVVRYRSGYAMGDIGRIQTQQAFLKALASQLLQIGNITKVKEFANIFTQYVDTNLTVGNIVWFGMQFLQLKEENINFMMLPGNVGDSVNGLSYVSIYLYDWVDMINAYINPFQDDISASNLNVLTRDSNGNLYATTGYIAGGLDSFYGSRSNGSGSGSSSNDSKTTETESGGSTGGNTSGGNSGSTGGGESGGGSGGSTGGGESGGGSGGSTGGGESGGESGGSTGGGESGGESGGSTGGGESGGESGGSTGGSESGTGGNEEG